MIDLCSVAVAATAVAFGHSRLRFFKDLFPFEFGRNRYRFSNGSAGGPDRLATVFVKLAGPLAAMERADNHLNVALFVCTDYCIICLKHPSDGDLDPFNNKNEVGRRGTRALRYKQPVHYRSSREHYKVAHRVFDRHSIIECFSMVGKQRRTIAWRTHVINDIGNKDNNLKKKLEQKKSPFKREEREIQK